MTVFVYAAPQGLAPAAVFIINDTAISVSWTAPSQPNGQVLAYNLYVSDGRKIVTGMNVPGAYILGGLLAYTAYTVQVSNIPAHVST